MKRKNVMVEYDQIRKHIESINFSQSKAVMNMINTFSNKNQKCICTDFLADDLVCLLNQKIGSFQ